MKKVFKIGFVLFIANFYQCNKIDPSNQTEFNSLAESYVKLVLKIGLYDSDYVDAYYGPEEWKPEPLKNDSNPVFPYQTYKNEVNGLIHRLEKMNLNRFHSIRRLRYEFLNKQLLSVRAQIELLAGNKMTFDEESKLLFDIVAPAYDTKTFDHIFTAIDTLLPGEGSVSQRWKAFDKMFLVESEKADTLFRTSLTECRKRTLEHIQLPQNENFTVEYVQDKPWGAYNWYKGDYQSLLQFNTSTESSVFSILHTASHEGYPGHHVNYSLMDKHLFHDKKWIEFSIYPLYSPSSLIAEGLASYGLEMIFTEPERIDYEKQVLFPLAGLDTSKVDLYHQIRELLKPRSGASIYIAREYLDGYCSKDEAILFIEKYLNMPHEDAKAYLEFFEQYRSYIVNYKLGYDLVKNYVEKTDDPRGRWKRFNDLLCTPRTASSLVQY
jgi:hypothetical protein